MSYQRGETVKDKSENNWCDLANFVTFMVRLLIHVLLNAAPMALDREVIMTCNQWNALEPILQLIKSNFMILIVYE